MTTFQKKSLDYIIIPQNYFNILDICLWVLGQFELIQLLTSNSLFSWIWVSFV